MHICSPFAVCRCFTTGFLLFSVYTNCKFCLCPALICMVFLSYLGMGSVEGYRALVERYFEVEVSGLGRDGQPITVTAKGWKARILQHECDHLQGILYVDRMVPRSFRTTQNLRLPLPAGCHKPGICMSQFCTWRSFQSHLEHRPEGILLPCLCIESSHLDHLSDHSLDIPSQGIMFYGYILSLDCCRPLVRSKYI
jgi:hypothetical protein